MCGVASATPSIDLGCLAVAPPLAAGRPRLRRKSSTECKTTPPPAVAEHELRFVELCATQLGLVARLPKSERTYVNLVPPKRFGTKRAAAFEIRSGRVEIYCDPAHADTHPLADEVRHNGVPVAVKVYLTSPAAVDEAITLTRIGLDER